MFLTDEFGRAVVAMAVGGAAGGACVAFMHAAGKVVQIAFRAARNVATNAARNDERVHRHWRRTISY